MGKSFANSKPQSVRISAFGAADSDAFHADDIYSVLQHVSSNRSTMNPHIFGSSRFTRETESETSLDCYYGRADGCFDDIDRDLQSLETSLASGSSNASAEDWNIIQSSCYDESMDSQFASLAISQNVTSNAFNLRTSEPSSRNTTSWL